MTKRLLIVSGVLHLVSLVGVFAARALPTEVKQEITPLSYEHQGRFDYRAHQKASYLLGDLPLETGSESPPLTPKYPADR